MLISSVNMCGNSVILHPFILVFVAGVCVNNVSLSEIIVGLIV